MKRIAVLMSDRETNDSLGFIEIGPSGMMMLQGFKGGVHPNSLRQYANLVGEPLYVKHADIISRNKVLSDKLLIAESQSLAALINEKPRMLGKLPIMATSVESRYPRCSSRRSLKQAIKPKAATRGIDVVDFLKNR